MTTQPPNQITAEELLALLGDTTDPEIMRVFYDFASIPNACIESLAQNALQEDWGDNHYALRVYLAITTRWSIEQGCFTTRDGQFYVTAGQLQTRYGTPLYCVFQRNRYQGAPFALVAADTNISAPELPAPPAIPSLANLQRGAEIVMKHEHILGDNIGRLSFLAATPRVAQLCAISGAIQWSLNRHLELPYWYHGKMQYVIPLYLENRENIAVQPDAIAPVQVFQDNLLVPTVLPAHAKYPNTRVAVARHDQLSPWLLDAWKNRPEEPSDDSRGEN